ncbi:unnamed protein product [Phytomonas sp. EM1]|nr:unnamed protein product [Phytomonas sp. EM1]|eukprot:CCW63490.1 unnamed protein product [Phytomonas sp. isolate EM1]
MQSTGAPPAPDARGFVTCAKHDTRRKVAYCTIKPVYDADLAVVAHQYECKEGQTCTTRRTAGQQSPPNIAKTNVGSDANGEGRRESPPVMEVIDCSSSRMLGGDGRGWERVKNGGRSGGSSATTVKDTGAFSILFTKKADSGVANDPADHGVLGEGGVSSDGMSGEDEDDKVGGDEAMKGDLQCPPVVSVAAGLHSEKPSSRQAANAVASPSPRTALSSRYFDLGPNGGGGGERGGIFPAKVCWNCGLPDHEKSNCPNILCRNCHGRRGAMNTTHVCGEVRVASPFIVLPRSVAELPQGANGMPAVRCVRCGGLGHFDCGGNTSNGGNFAVDDVSLSCCYCGARGHTGYDCHKRQRAHPDRWVQWNLAAAARRENARSGHGHANSAVSSFPGPSSARGSPASHPQSFFRDSYDRHTQDGERSFRRPHPGDTGPSNAYRSAYNRWGHQASGAHDGHRSRDAYYGEDGGDSRRFRRVETATYRDAAYGEDRSARHSRPQRAEGREWGGEHQRSGGDVWRRGRQEDSHYRYDRRPAQSRGGEDGYTANRRERRGGGRRGYSGFSSDEDLF